MMVAVHVVLGAMYSRFACCATPFFFVFDLRPPPPKSPKSPHFCGGGGAIAALRNPRCTTRLINHLQDRTPHSDHATATRSQSGATPPACVRHPRPLRPAPLRPAPLPCRGKGGRAKGRRRIAPRITANSECNHSGSESINIRDAEVASMAPHVVTLSPPSPAPPAPPPTIQLYSHLCLCPRRCPLPPTAQK